MNAPRMSIDDVKRAANARPEELLSALGIAEPFNRSGYISMSSPVRKDRKPSFTIWFKNGFLAWRDEATQEKGDVIGLVAHVRRWEHLPKKGVGEACRFIKDVFGLEQVTREQLERDRAHSRRQAAEIQKKAGEEQARKEGQAMALWLNAVPIAGTIGDVYLRDARGIDLGLLPKGVRGGDRMPDVLRFIAGHKHTESGRVLPCMIAGCVDYGLETPAIRAVHRTWLKPDGSDKADVEPQRKVWPGFAGLVIPIWRGETNMTVRHACEAGLCETLVLTEGIEDGLTAALAEPKHRVWAMIALGNMANVPVPSCIDSIIVHRQNDWDKRQAVAQFERGKAALEASGRRVAEAMAVSGKDLNDTLRARGLSAVKVMLADAARELVRN